MGSVILPYRWERDPVLDRPTPGRNKRQIPFVFDYIVNPSKQTVGFSIGDILLINPQQSLRDSERFFFEGK